MINKSVTNNTWEIEIIQNNGSETRIIWNTIGASTYHIPDSWSNVRMMELTGDTTIITSDTVEIGIKPILLEKYETTDISKNYNPHRFNISVYPNPTSSNITIKFNNEKKKKYSVKVHNSKGKLLKEYNNIHSNMIVIQKYELPAGLLFISINDNAGNFEIINPTWL